MSKNNKTDYAAIKATNVAQVAEKTQTEQKPTPGPKKQIAVATEQKRSLMSRLFNGVFGPDRVKNVKGYIGREIILPGLKETARNGLHTFIDMMMYRDGAPKQSGGWSNPSAARTPNYNNNRTNYNRIYGQSKQAPTEYTGHDVNPYTIPDRTQALEVLDALRNDLNRFGQVSVADYYDYIGVPTTFNDQTIGWVDLSTAKVVATRGGFTIDLPYPDTL